MHRVREPLSDAHRPASRAKIASAVPVWAKPKMLTNLHKESVVSAPSQEADQFYNQVAQHNIYATHAKHSRADRKAISTHSTDREA